MANLSKIDRSHLLRKNGTYKVHRSYSKNEVTFIPY